MPGCRLSRSLLGLFLLFSLQNCSGSGGDGGGGTPALVAVPEPTTVSGTVQAPSGQVASFRQRSISDFFESEAYAGITGLALVSDGTTVELGRVSLTAPFTFSSIASTVTSGGRYSFNLTSLGAPPAVNLVVRVKNGVTEMRAFVTGPTVHLSPMSEVAFLKSTQELAGNPLTHYTIQELADITGSITLLANLQNLSFTAQNVAQSLASIANVVQGNIEITNFIAAAASPGHSSQGPGDIGNFYPFDQGIVWRYQGTVSRNNSLPVAFQNSVMISGDKTVNGVNTLVVFHSNHDNQGRTEEGYLTKDATGIIQHGTSDQTSPITSQLVPIRSVHFP